MPIRLPPKGPDGGAPSRIVISDLTPLVDLGTWPVKRVEHEPVDVGATVYAEGHDRLRVVVVHTPPAIDGARPHRVAMDLANAGLDRWQCRFVPVALGDHTYQVLAWVDRVGSWLDGTRRKLAAGVDVSSELTEGAVLLREAAARAGEAHETVPGPLPDPLAPGSPSSPGEVAAALRRWAERLDAGDVAPVEHADDADGLATLAARCLTRAGASASAEVPVRVERERALFCAWYELFPRSWGPAPGVHGTLRDVIDQLDEVADLGVDVVYLPPVHPIGTSFRKGPDNTEVAGPDDPGSPWAIGSPDGGHTAVHPELGTVADVADLAAACAERGMELALDIALQCSPDHPWVTEHPGWFRHRPDGTIQYAENPPKKYQDIYPLDFACADWKALWKACRDVFVFWAERGVRVFRVDNPHTKPFAFWAWCLASVRERFPDAIFLSEAFTRPAPMHRLAAVGFTQSYGYFPWRVHRDELQAYFTEVSSSPSADDMRPSSWPTTPDILPWHLQGAPKEAFALRLVLAATLSPSYGIYGPAFELADNRGADNGKEEYGASEKYQLRWWDRADPRSLRGLVRAVNQARRDQAALHTLRTLHFHDVGNPMLIVFSKTAHGGPEVDPGRPSEASTLVVVNLDPGATQSGVLALDLPALGVDPSRPYTAHDLLGGDTYTWVGPDPYVELHPDRTPAHVLRITQPPVGVREVPR